MRRADDDGHQDAGDSALLADATRLVSDATYAQQMAPHPIFSWRVGRALCPSALRPAVLRFLLRPTRIVYARLMPGRARSIAFARIYQAGGWGEEPTVSGPGSDLQQTARIIAELPVLLNEFGARSILDAPCGDLFWMKECTLGPVQYIGMDIVPELIEANRTQFGGSARRFITGDLVTADLPRVDVVLCRDCLVHLRTADTLRALRNIKRSGSTYILTTTFPSLARNKDLGRPGGWRPINLEREPFRLPPPVRALNEGCTEDNGEYADKSLGLWKLSDLPV